MLKGINNHLDYLYLSLYTMLLNILLNTKVKNLINLYLL